MHKKKVFISDTIYYSLSCRTLWRWREFLEGRLPNYSIVERGSTIWRSRKIVLIRVRDLRPNKRFIKGSFISSGKGASDQAWTTSKYTPWPCKGVAKPAWSTSQYTPNQIRRLHAHAHIAHHINGLPENLSTEYKVVIFFTFMFLKSKKNYNFDGIRDNVPVTLGPNKGTGFMVSIVGGFAEARRRSGGGGGEGGGGRGGGVVGVVLPSLVLFVVGLELDAAAVEAHLFVCFHRWRTTATRQTTQKDKKRRYCFLFFVSPCRLRALWSSSSRGVNLFGSIPFFRILLFLIYICFYLNIYI